METPSPDFNYFLAKCNELANEADSYGYPVLILIDNQDPIARQSGMASVSRGPITTLLGMLHLAILQIKV